MKKVQLKQVLDSKGFYRTPKGVVMTRQKSTPLGIVCTAVTSARSFILNENLMVYSIEENLR